MVKNKRDKLLYTELRKTSVDKWLGKLLDDLYSKIIVFVVLSFIFTALLRLFLTVELVAIQAVYYMFGEKNELRANSSTIIVMVCLFTIIFLIYMIILRRYAKDQMPEDKSEKPIMPRIIVTVSFVCYLYCSFLLEIGATVFRTESMMGDFYDQKKEFVTLFMVAGVGMIFLKVGKYFFHQSKELQTLATGIFVYVFIRFCVNVRNVFGLISDYGFTFNRILAIWCMLVVLLLSVQMLISVYRPE